MRKFIYADLHPKWIDKTKQKFTCKDKGIYLNQEYFCDFTVCNVLDIMNNLIEKNEELKLDIREHRQTLSRVELRRKQFKDKVFEAIDKRIRENQHNYDEYSILKVHVLEELKAELIMDD